MTRPSGGERRVYVSAQGRYACSGRGDELDILRLPDLEHDAQVGIEHGSDVAIVGELVVVVGPGGALHLVDPRGASGPSKVWGAEVDPGSRIAAVSGAYALLACARGAQLLHVSDAPTLVRVPSRGTIHAAGPAGNEDHFIVAVSGTLEEWSAPTRAPVRRWRFEKPLVPSDVGANARHLWLIPDATAARVLMLPLVGGARASELELPEPAARAIPDAAGTRLAIVGSATGACYLADLRTRAVTQVHAGPRCEVAWWRDAVLVRAGDDALAIVEVPGGEPDAIAEPGRPRPTATTTAHRLAAWKERVRQPEPDAAPSASVPSASSASAPSASAPSASSASAASASSAPAPSAASVASAPSASSAPSPPPARIAELPSVQAFEVLDPSVPQHEWRDAVAAWARRVLSGLSGDPPLLAACPLYDVGARLGLVDEDATVLWLLYGARLCGADGVAPVDLVPFCARRWEDALGRSHLAQSGAFVWRRARVQLAREVADTLDDLPSRYGQVCSGPPVPPRTVAVVAPSSVALAAVGSWAARRVGSLVVPSDRGLRVPDRFVLEARARGQVPLIAARAWGDRSAPATAAVFVVDDAAAAARRGLPVALTWPAEVTSAR